MKRLLSIVYLSVVMVTAASATEAIHISRKPNETGVVQCECIFRRNYGTDTRDISLYGKVRYVTGDADLRVYVALPGEISDLVVEWVDHTTFVCGEWQWVDSGEDFTVQVVSDPEDANMVIEYGETDHCDSCDPCWEDEAPVRLH